MGSQDIPKDVWYNVINFLPEETVLGLHGVNEAFRDMAHSIRYKALRITSWDKNTKQTLKDLSDPSISSVVGSVHLQPWIEEVYQPRRGRIIRTWKSVSSVMAPEATDRKLKDRVERKHKKHVRRCSDTLQQLPCVTEYAIVFDEGVAAYDPDCFTAFLEKLLIGTPFGTNLTSLQLKLPPDKMGRMARVVLPNLTDLDFAFATGAMESEEFLYHATGFITFINNLKDSLRALSFSSTRSSQHLDLYHIFDRLGTFPRLNSFSLVMPFHGLHVSNLEIVAEFLKKHNRGLETLKLGMSSVGGKDSGTEESRLWIPNLIHALRNTPSLSLDTVDLTLRPLREHYIEQLSEDLSTIAPCLRSLTLRDRSLTLQEVSTIVGNIANPHLQHLAFRVQYLSPQLIDLLAKVIPSLQRLEISFSEIVRRDIESEDGFIEIVGSRSTMLNLFCDEMRRAPYYITWSLQKLSLSFPPVHTVDGKRAVEQVLKQCIPSLRYFGDIPFIQYL